MKRIIIIVALLFLVGAGMAGQTYLDYTQINNVSVPQANVSGLVSDLAGKEPAISQGVSPQFWIFNKTWQNITTTWIAEGVNLWFTDARVMTVVQSYFDYFNATDANLQANDSIHDAKFDNQNASKVNKTDAGELSGGTLISGVLSQNTRRRAISWAIGDGSAVITVGTKANIEVPTNCTIQSVRFGGNYSINGNISMNIYNNTYTNLGNLTNPINPSPILVSNSYKMENNTLAGWTTTLQDRYWLTLQVVSVDTIKSGTLSIRCLED